MHVTLRVVRRLPNLRREALFLALRGALAESSRAAFRLVHFSVQLDHIHLIVEANDRDALSRGMAGLSIRAARSINRKVGRCGRVFADRYHARPLISPREVRHCLVYVLMNFKKHLAHPNAASGSVDMRSSGPWFDGWKDRQNERDPPNLSPGERPPVRRAQTWLARTGWRRYGLIRLNERPAML